MPMAMPPAYLYIRLRLSRRCRRAARAWVGVILPLDLLDVVMSIRP